jgi:GMP synthase (glutamine-hydrolysing)
MIVNVLVIHSGTSYLNQLLDYLDKSNVLVTELNFETITKKLKHQMDKNPRAKHTFDISNNNLRNTNAVIYAGGTIRESLVPGIYRKIKRWSMNFIRALDLPFLGICLGHMMLGFTYGATYQVMRRRIKDPIQEEKGIKEVNFYKEFPLAPSKSRLRVYEDHERELSSLPNCLINTATSKDSEIQAIYHINKQQYGVQFHPEVTGTDGWIVLNNFLQRI